MSALGTGEAVTVASHVVLLGRSRTLALKIGLLTALLLAGCGGESPSGPSPPVPRIADAPESFRPTYRQANELIRVEGADGFQALIESAQGPVLVNKWASWCFPCREEFPLLRDFTLDNGTEILVIGLLSESNEDAARTFLRDHPVPYPSVIDTDTSIGSKLIPSIGVPATAIFSQDGERIAIHEGPFSSAKEVSEWLRGEGVT